MHGWWSRPVVTDGLEHVDGVGRGALVLRRAQKDFRLTAKTRKLWHWGILGLPGPFALQWARPRWTRILARVWKGLGRVAVRFGRHPKLDVDGLQRSSKGGCSRNLTDQDQDLEELCDK